MNNFLTRIKNIIRHNPHLMNENFKDFLYTELISFNLGNGEPFKNMEHLFDDWIYRNRNKDNLQTFVSEKYPYFCQFANRDAVNIAGEAIKLYIPLNENRLYEGANRLFDFIAKENIHHNSKIGKKIRNDNVVVRVSNMEEAIKVIEFVKNDPYIQDGLMNTNPFTINVNGVGIAKDGFRSYNGELCNHLGKFINILVSKDRLDDLNMSTFHEYLDTVKDFGDKDLQLITKLQCEVTSGRELTLDDFRNIIDGKDLEQSVDKEEIFRKVVKLTFDKYGMNHTINAIARFRYNGSDVGFTRDNGARYELTINKITMDDVNKFLENSNTREGNAIEDYINSIVGKKNDLFSIIENAYKETFNKYGNRQAATALENYILYGETKYITNTNNAREDIKEINHSEVIDIIKEGLAVDNYISNEELVDYFIDEMENKYMHRNYSK